MDVLPVLHAERAEESNRKIDRGGEEEEVTRTKTDSRDLYML